MAIFVIEWPGGREEVVEQSDCKTVEQFVNCRFGSAKTKAKVRLADEVKAEAPKKSKKAE